MNNLENMTPLELFNHYNGLEITIFGIIFVYIGIIIIQVCLNLFNMYFLSKANKSASPNKRDTVVEKMPIPDIKEEPVSHEEVPEDELIAIAAAIELYRRLHFDRLPSKITFTRGMDAQNAWQSGAHFGHRNS